MVWESMQPGPQQPPRELVGPSTRGTPCARGLALIPTRSGPAPGTYPPAFDRVAASRSSSHCEPPPANPTYARTHARARAQAHTQIHAHTLRQRDQGTDDPETQCGRYAAQRNRSQGTGLLVRPFKTTRPPPNTHPHPRTRLHARTPQRTPAPTDTRNAPVFGQRACPISYQNVACVSGAVRLSVVDSVGERVGCESGAVACAFTTRLLRSECLPLGSFI